MTEDKFNGNKPDQKTIEEIKAKFPNCNISGYPFPGMYIIYRSYTMSEQEELIRAREVKETELNRPLTESEIESMVLERFVVYPSNFQERLAEKSIPAGLPQMLVSYIMVMSGFVELKPDLL